MRETQRAIRNSSASNPIFHLYKDLDNKGEGGKIAERESEIPEAEEVVVSIDLEIIDTDIKDEELRSAELDLKHYWYAQGKRVKIGYMDGIPVHLVFKKQIEYPQAQMAFTTVQVRVVATKPLGEVRITPRTKLKLFFKGAGEVKK